MTEQNIPVEVLEYNLMLAMVRLMVRYPDAVERIRTAFDSVLAAREEMLADAGVPTLH